MCTAMWNCIQVLRTCWNHSCNAVEYSTWKGRVTKVKEFEKFYGSRLTFSMITSYAEIRSVATKRRVLASTSKISLTLPLAIFLKPSGPRSIAVTALPCAIVVVDMMLDAQLSICRRRKVWHVKRQVRAAHY